MKRLMFLTKLKTLKYRYLQGFTSKEEYQEVKSYLIAEYKHYKKGKRNGQ